MLLLNLKSRHYKSIISYMLSNCERFSLVFERESANKYVHENFYLKLSDFVITKDSVIYHPDTGTKFENCDLCFFKCVPTIAFVLLGAKDPFDWNGTNLPEEICFYKNGKIFLKTIVHEHLCVIENETDKDILFLKNKKIPFVYTV